MMNYYYPIDLDAERDDLEEAAKKLVDLPLCIVTFEDSDTIALALTGGGMDLSWEICEAYMLLGYLPPLHFCDLPGISGRGTSNRDKWIIAGCRRSAKFNRDNAYSTIKHLARFSQKEAVK